MQQPDPSDPAAVAAAFDVPLPIGPVLPLGSGLINDTYSVTAGGAPRPVRFVLQRINGRVFPAPERILANHRVLAEHARRLADPGLKVPAPIAARDGSPGVTDRAGGVWRLMELIEDARPAGRVESLADARAVGSALGRFHRLTADLPAGAMAVTLPGFHCTPLYLLHLREAAQRPPPDELASPEAVADVREAIEARAGLAGVLEDARAAGRIRERVVHGDPKSDNILLHRTDGRPLALVDLDTVQPGLIQHDLGDCLRSCCNRRGESASDGAPVRFDLKLCGALLGAYAREAGDVLGPGDLALLYDGIRLMPFELAIRFLADHLEGDRWFRVPRRGASLDKARVQLALLRDIEAREEEIRAVIADAFGTCADGDRRS